ncbi:MAG: alpha/beta hydrolase [Bryobacterales bacterium]|nr:alpha/beta hydrolase [Bryobacterales bacterium]MBV9399480.1 alpha/beta hydrolase [Bryobacterales bacterium]
MRAVLVLGVFGSALLNAGAPPSRLKESQLEAVHEARIDWLKQRVNRPPLGVYRDFRAAFTHHSVAKTDLLKAARDALDQVVFAEDAAGDAQGVLFLPLPGPDLQSVEIYTETSQNASGWRKLRGLFKQFPDEVLGSATDFDSDAVAKWDRETAARPVTGIAFSDSPLPAVISYSAAFRNTSTHILARDLTEESIRGSLSHGHAYVAHDWLCDPTGFTFFAANNLGVFDVGDTVPTGLLAGRTELQAYLPVKAKIKLIRNGAVLTETEGAAFSYTVKDPGVFRMEAWLTAGGQDRPWILSNPIYVGAMADIRLPVADTSNVELRAGIAYTEGSPEDAEKHKLDLYLPKDKTNFATMVFVHGGSWRTGDRSLYAALGYYFARRGIAVAIPSYRLMPKYPHPAQMEDVAAAFAWVYRNSVDFGADATRIYVAGHSAGGHLVSLMAADHAYLEKHKIPASAIRGVISISGVYDVRSTPAFEFDGNKAQASPVEFITRRMPPFLITYCQWDYLGLPKQARDFAADMKRSFDSIEVLYIPGESHISEIISAVQDGSALSRAILDFVK